MEFSRYQTLNTLREGKLNMSSHGLSKEKLRVAFIHPDLGIGGAERLVVDAAMGLQEQGHEVIIYTSHCNRSHCFEEVKTGTLKVKVYGDMLPTNFMGKFFIMFATLRQLYLTLSLIATGQINEHDIFIVDQLSTCVPFIKCFTKTGRVLFYCHFPDQLLAKRTSIIKRMYRIPFDFIEQVTMGAADGTVVNSNFTKSVFKKTFSLLSVIPDVVYPCVDLHTQSIDEADITLYEKILPSDVQFYLSINRFEKKKNIELAITSFASSKESDRRNAKLIVVGGYDERVTENKECLRNLEELSTNLGLSHITLHYAKLIKEFEKIDIDVISNAKIIFVTSISSSFKELLLQRTRLLLYTPSYEHFGIVPLEAMKLGKPVLAVNNGGPLETVVTLKPNENENESTGWLRRSDAKEWAGAIDESVKYLESSETIFKTNGPRRVREKFSRDAMTRDLEFNIGKTSPQYVNTRRQASHWAPVKILATVLMSLFLYYLHGSKIWSMVSLAVLSVVFVYY